MNKWLFEQINAFARATPWLHGAARVYAGYGVVLFAALLLAGWWIARRSREVSRVAAAITAGGATLLALAVNQLIVHAVHEARPYTTLTNILVRPTAARTRRSPPITPPWPVPSPSAC